MQKFVTDKDFGICFEAAIAVLSVRGLKEDNLTETQKNEIKDILAEANKRGCKARSQ